MVLSALALGEVPFTVMQILWINLMMDVLGAIALATEAPHPTELAGLQKDKENTDIIQPVMRRTIYF
jgi:Ca2+-transporting ATPase